MKKILLMVIFSAFNQLIAQEIVGFRDLYEKNELTYKIADGQVFSGQAQNFRKNGHLVYEEYFEDGYLTKSILYYNGTEKATPARVTEFYENSSTKKKEINFGLSEPTTEIKYFDRNGKKTLIERYENEKLTYRCEYLNNKKNGTEFCLKKDGTELEIKYKNGKKIK